MSLFCIHVVDDITPTVDDYELEMLVFGAQDLKAHMMIPAQSPFVELSVELGGQQRDISKATTTGSGANPTYGKIVTMKLPLPRSPEFCPRLEIRVKDSRLRGLSKPVLGNVAIDLPQ